MLGYSATVLAPCTNPATTHEGKLKKAYESPTLVSYGSIADNTFATPHGQVKGCQIDCHIDNFGEQSANEVSGGS